MKRTAKEQNDSRALVGIAALERAAREASTDEERLLLEQAAADLARSAAKRASLREKRKRSEERWKRNSAERDARLAASTPAAEAPFPLEIERTDEVADFTNLSITWARVWKGTTKKGTRLALAVCSIAVENDETAGALGDPGISGDLEQWLVSSTGGGPPPCDIKDDFEANDLEHL